MTPEKDLYELLYVSCIADKSYVSVVADIAHQSRMRNARSRITGLLLFDGARFAQHIEGDVVRVHQLFGAIEADPRHTSVQVLQRGSSEQRKFRRFSLGYAHVAAEEPLLDLGQRLGIEARKAFTSMLSSVDFEP